MDPNFAEHIAGWRSTDSFLGPLGRADRSQWAQAIALAHKAVELDPNDAGARWVLGHILHYERRFAEAEAGFEVALRLDPNHADAWRWDRTWQCSMDGRKDGIAEVQRLCGLTLIHRAGTFGSLVRPNMPPGAMRRPLRACRRDETYRSGSRRMLAAAFAQLGRLEEARREAEMFMLSNPHFRWRQWVEVTPARDESVKIGTSRKAI